MTDTVDIDIVTTGWTEFADSITGIVSNGSGNDIVVREDDIDPGASVTTGHPLNPGDTFNFALAASQKMWARSIGTESFVVVTGAA